MRKRTVAKALSDNSNQLVETNRTFFCSELLAKAFKILGIMEDDDTSCTQFYPQHFTEHGDSFLKLTEGT